MSFPRPDGHNEVDRHIEAIVRANAAVGLLRHAIAGDIPLVFGIAAAADLLDEATAWEAWAAMRPPPIDDLDDEELDEEQPY